MPSGNRVRLHDTAAPIGAFSSKIVVANIAPRVDRRRVLRSRFLSRFECRLAGLPLLAGMMFVAMMSPASAQSLDDVLASVYLQNPHLQAERAQLKAADEGIDQARGGWRPTVSMTINGGYSNASQTQTNAVFGPSYFNQSQNPASYGLQLTQPLYLGGKTVAATRKAKALVAAETAHLASVEQSVLLQAATDYMDVVAAQETYDLSITHEAELQKDLHEVTVRFTGGELTRTDEAQAEAAVAQGAAYETDAASALHVASDAYERDIGTRPGHLATPAFSSYLPDGKSDAADVAQTSNPDVLTAKYSISAAQSDIKVTRSQLLPSITLNASAERATDPGLQLSRTDNETVVAQLSVPLYEAGIVYSQTREAEDTLVVKEHDADQAVRVAEAQANAAWDQAQAAAADVLSYQAQANADAVAVKGMKEEARTGERTVFDILNAEATLYQAQAGLIRASHDEMVAKFNLATAIGGFTAKALELPVAYYDPEKHLRMVEDKWIGFGNGDQPPSPRPLAEPTTRRH